MGLTIVCSITVLLFTNSFMVMITSLKHTNCDNSDLDCQGGTVKDFPLSENVAALQLPKEKNVICSRFCIVCHWTSSRGLETYSLSIRGTVIYINIFKTLDFTWSVFMNLFHLKYFMIFMKKKTILSLNPKHLKVKVIVLEQHFYSTEHKTLILLTLIYNAYIWTIAFMRLSHAVQNIST